MSRNHPHIAFQKKWTYTDQILLNIGKCEAVIDSISSLPLQPEYYDYLLKVSLSKGAQATTAIEGNTLSDADIIKIQKGESLSPSKEYDEIEVKNILDAFSKIFNKVVEGSFMKPINPQLLLRSVSCPNPGK